MLCVMVVNDNDGDYVSNDGDGTDDGNDHYDVGVDYVGNARDYDNYGGDDTYWYYW